MNGNDTVAITNQHNESGMSSNILLFTDSLVGGFLCWLIESSVEKPIDGLNGNCIVRYGNKDSKYMMRVKLVNGLREGMGTIMKEGVPFIQIQYHNGLVNGPVRRMDDYGVINLKGHLVNGRECGLFEEYDRKETVVWRGYYQNGQKYSEVKRDSSMEGYYVEYRVLDGEVLSIAEYDINLTNKSGRCFEYRNGFIKNECVYENGEKRHTIREFVNGKMVAYGAKGEKVYEGKWFGNMESGFLCHEPMEGMSGFFKEVNSRGQLISVSEYDELNVYKNGKCFELENGKVKRVCEYQSGKLIRVIMRLHGDLMIQYDMNGKRVYEGGYLGNMKTGFLKNKRGVELDEKENIKRVCFYVNGVLRQVIQTFYGDTMIENDESGRMVYEGGFKGDRMMVFVRDGYGYCMDGNGKDLQQCLYNSGVVIRVIREFDQSEMTEYDDNGNKRYVGGFIGDRKSGFKRNGRGYCLDEKGNVYQFCEFENGEVKHIIQEFNGSTMIEYDANGRKQYEGEFKGDEANGFVREGFGKEFRMVEEITKSVLEPVISIEKKRFLFWVKEIKHELPGTEKETISYREETKEGFWKNGVNVATQLPSNPIDSEQTHNSRSSTSVKPSGEQKETTKEQVWELRARMESVWALRDT